ncbi:heme-binding beta-barrel domain-containing protein [Thermomonas sp. HDW16]|uniref:FABP family protein n=1 Tax=Thermomonas sp. HDW16 TaxID=2714945 RepID=UPI001407AABD|nr:heme-binding beta-barrel domain-containing protein [Thermomonas sp. HDW16]QIL21192.1 FABP family protein [Thermomonas sp. HDW16]
MSKFPKHLFDEPDPDPHTLDNLGPLRPLAGIWENDQGEDVKPTADGAESQRYIERFELQPIDPQTNGPQLFYGLRYHTRIVKPGEVDMYHEQVGFWLWEPATGCILQSLTIPRGQIALAKGQAAADARSFSLDAERGSTENGICSNIFLEENFRTERFSITVTVNDDDTWSYDETTVLMIKGVPEPFMHTDRHTLRRVAQPTPNPMAIAADKG